MSNSRAFDTVRFGRTVVLIGFVTGVFLFVGAQRLEGPVFAVGAVAVGAIALITAIIGFLIAGVSYAEQGGG